MEAASNSCASDYFSFRMSDSSACVMWKVKDFSTLREEPKFYTSPDFKFKDVEWCLELYPFGYTDKNSGNVGLYLAPHSSFPSELRIQFFVKNETGEDKERETRKEFSDGKSWGFHEFLNREDLLDGKSGDYLPCDVLTIYCKMKIVEDVEIKTENFTGTEETAKLEGDSFLSGFRQSLDSGKLSDVVLRVGEETIPAHKVILSAHSEVFRAMFESDLKENKESVVDLIDMDSTVAKAMLLYIYTREVEDLSTGKTLELYVAADRYMLTELKEKCHEYVLKNISSENVGEVFEIAKLHSDVMFSDAAKHFFARNAKSILKSEEWKEYSAQKLSSSVELLSYAITSNDFCFF